MGVCQVHAEGRAGDAEVAGDVCGVGASGGGGGSLGRWGVGEVRGVGSWGKWKGGGDVWGVGRGERGERDRGSPSFRGASTGVRDSMGGGVNASMSGRSGSTEAES